MTENDGERPDEGTLAGEVRKAKVERDQRKVVNQEGREGGGWSCRGTAKVPSPPVRQFSECRDHQPVKRTSSWASGN